MKRILVATLAISLLATSAFAVVSGGSHDLSGAAWNFGANGTTTATAEICIVCHTPHNALVAVPLWNRANPTSTFTMYPNIAGDTMDGVTSATGPNAISAMCLSCHDGVTGLESFGSATATTVNPMGAVAGNFGTDLSNDHPISVTYVTGTAGEEMNATTATFASTNGTTVADLLFSNSVECASCHDVHADNTGAVGEVPYMLVASNTGSKLCLACHAK